MKQKLLLLLLASLFFTGMQAQEPEPPQEPLQLRDTILTYYDKTNISRKWRLSYCTLSDGTKLFFGRSELDTTNVSSGYFCLSLYRIQSNQPTLDIPRDYLYSCYPASLRRVMVAQEEYQCDFQKITVPDGTEVVELPQTTSLVTLDLPQSLVQLEFTFTSVFKDLYLRSVYPPRCANSLASKLLTDITIHVPAIAMDQYAQTSPFKSGTLAALEEPIEHLTVGWKPYTIQNTEGLADNVQLTVPRWYSVESWGNRKGYSSNILTRNDYKVYNEHTLIYHDGYLTRTGQVDSCTNYSLGVSDLISYGNQSASSFYPAQLTVDAESPLNLKKFRLEQDCGQYWFKNYADPVNKAQYKITPSTAIFNSPVTAEEIEMTYHLFYTNYRYKGEDLNNAHLDDWGDNSGTRFYLVSFPFDIRLSDITFPPLQNKWNMKVICMEFDGEKHATVNGGFSYWRQLSGDEVLHANHGYLIDFYGEVASPFTTTGAGSIEWYDAAEEFQQTTLHLRAMDTENKQQIFANGDVSIPLKACPSKFRQRQGWNLIGNPYPCFFDIHHLDYSAPITVYDGFNYYAFSPIDDDYYLYPNEAFFVQCPDGVSSVTFKKEGRLHNDPGGLWQFSTSSSQMPPKRRMPESDAARRVYNFMLNGEDGFDRARVVINEEASADYELERDAAKMMGQAGPQMYVLDGGVQYAIDERPLEDGTFTLGMVFPAKGTYALSLKDNPDEQTPVILTDLLTGTETDLTQATYTFDAAAGAAADRFSVRIGERTPTQVQTVTEASGEPVYYDMQGRIVADPSAMQKGVYILKQGQTTRKIVK